MSVDGLNLRRVGRLLGVSHQRVSNGVKAPAVLCLPPTLSRLHAKALTKSLWRSSNQSGGIWDS